MFNNVGEKIKSFVKVIFFLVCIMALVFPIWFFKEYGPLVGVVSFAIVVLGLFIVWCCLLGIYGFGQLIENSDIIVEYIEEIQDRAQLESRVAVQKPTFMPSSYEAEAMPQNVEDDMYQPPATNGARRRNVNRSEFSDNPDAWVCPRCGGLNHRSRDICKDCGAHRN